MKTKQQQVAPPQVFRLPTQEKRASFVRREMRRLGWSINELAEHSGVYWTTAARFAGLTDDPSQFPRTDTTRLIFRALGYDLCFTTKNARGVIEL